VGSAPFAQPCSNREQGEGARRVLGDALAALEHLSERGAALRHAAVAGLLVEPGRADGVLRASLRLRGDRRRREPMTRSVVARRRRIGRRSIAADVLRSRPSCSDRGRRAPIAAVVDGCTSVVLRSWPSSMDPHPSCSDLGRRRWIHIRRAPISAVVDGSTSVVLRSWPSSMDAHPSCSDLGRRRWMHIRRAPIAAVVDGSTSVVLPSRPSCSDPGRRRWMHIRRAPP
jgi:hypothetical protein